MPSRHVLVGAALFSVLVVAGAGGCLFQNISPTEQLNDQVYSLNEEARWGRLDLAVRRVSPTYQGTFMTSRRSWGRRVAIADVEVSAIVITPGSDEATSSVELSWYDQQTMELRSTVIRQRWARSTSGYLLDEETVTGGDEELLELPDDDDEAATDEETTAGGAAPQG
jgi:hypothetical protein